MAFRLETLGGLRLIASDGQEAQAQRRRLALLALLAAAGDRGLTRDQLMGYLWAEASEDNAKHALNQLLYGIRRSLGDDAVRGLDPLRLDRGVVDSDVQRFESAIAAGAHADAVTHYRGPFLDGFYLADAPEFGRRVEQERTRLATVHADALERLATEAERVGDTHAAVVWRRTLTELDRLDARRATAFMRALVAAGDSSGALAHGRVYEAVVREELNAPADPAVLALAAEIRASVERHALTAAASASAISSDVESNTVTRNPATPLGTPLNEVEEAARTPAGGVGNGAATERDANAQAVVASRPQWPRRRLAFGVAALTLAAVSFAATRLKSVSHDSFDIAVLPLKNLSTDPRDASVADGMTEALIAVLSRGDLRVVPSTSVFALKDQDMDVRRRADRFHVGHILEGNVQRAGSHLRMQLRLVAADGSLRWSEIYDRKMAEGEIFAIYDDISRAVIDALHVRLGRGDRHLPTPGRHTPTVEAYDWYRQAMNLRLSRDSGAIHQGIEYLNRAIEADSSFAAAYAGVAGFYLREGGANPPANYRELFRRSLDAALKAVALDDSLAEGHAALGWALHTGVARDWVRAEAELKRAIALDRNTPRAFEGLARVYLWTGRRDGQLSAARAAVEVDRFSHSAARELALALAMNGRCDEAIEYLTPFKALEPRAEVVGILRGQCYASEQQWSKAIDEFRWAMGGKGAEAAPAFLGYALARAGQREEASRILADLVAGRKHSFGAFGIATVYLGFRDFDHAFAWLDKAVDEQSLRPYVMGPMFADLHRDARFDRVQRRLGLQPSDQKP